MIHEVLSRAEAYEAVIVAELREIEKDTKYLQACRRKYGEIMDAPLKHLQQEFRARKTLLKLLDKTVALMKQYPERSCDIWATFEASSMELY